MDEDLFVWTNRHGMKQPLSNMQSQNCDQKNPNKTSDTAVISQMELLPIRSLWYGPVMFEAQQATAIISSLTCYGKKSPGNLNHCYVGNCGESFL